jgi:manganese/zinc/iron transport system permease protein
MMIGSYFTLVMIGAGLIGMICAQIGFFAYLNKRSLVGDALAHSILPGVVAGFLCSLSRNPIYLMLGAMFSGMLATLWMQYLERKTRLKTDAIIALTMSSFSALGLCGLSFIQKLEAGDHAGLGDFLFGSIAAMQLPDIQLLVGVALLMGLLFWFFYHRFIAMAFNKEFMEIKGFPVKWYGLLMNLMLMITITLGIQLLGIVLISAMLILPVVAARFIVQSNTWIFRVSMLVGVTSALSGTYISSLSSGLPTGPVIILTMILLLGLMLIVKRLMNRHV